jgi:arsenate reductase-like glutaredoxin family protein
LSKLIKDKAENLVEALTEENPSDRMTTLSMLQLSIQIALFMETQQLLKSPIVIQFCEENGWAV